MQWLCPTTSELQARQTKNTGLQLQLSFPVLTGHIVSVYRKGHLFDVELTGRGVSLKESAFTIPGPALTPSVQTPIGKVSTHAFKRVSETDFMHMCDCIYKLVFA